VNTTGPGPGDDGEASPRPPGAGDATATGRFAADLPTGTVLAGRFRLDGLLGVGGMGVVYRATDLDLGVPVAVKLLRGEMAARPGAFERFRQELLLARQVSSPHVLRIHDIARHEDRWLISMDLVDGQPLDRLLDAEGALPVDRAVELTRQIALGLSAAHARDVVHRDLKPSNILVDAAGQARIGDFGIARSLGTSGLTGTGAIVGTPDYLSPEQARAQPVDARSDLYALGLLLYEMLSGAAAFAGSTASESLARRMVGPPPPIRSRRADVPGWVEQLLDRLLRSNPAHRLQSADAVVRAIEQQRVPRDLRPGRGSAIAATLLIATAAAGWFAWQRDQAPAAASAGAPPPARVLVLPIAADDARDADALVGASELLRHRLALGPLPVVDGERVDQAVAQLGLRDGRAATPDLRALRDALPATIVLRPRLRRVGTGLRLDAGLLRGDAAPVVLQGDVADGLGAALDAFAPRALLALADPGAAGPVSAPSPALAADDAALAGFGRALSLQREGRLDDAAAALDTLLAQRPRFAPGWLVRAQVAQQAGRAAAAGEAAAAGMALAPPPPLKRGLEHWSAMAGGDDAVLPTHAAWVAAHPDDLDARLRLAQLQGQSNALSAALENLRGLLARDPGDPRAWFLLGKSSILHGDVRGAVDEHLVRALVLYKRGRNRFGEAETVNALGVAYSRLGQPADAREQFTKAVALRRALGDRRGVASSLRNLAQLATVQGDFAQAQAHLDEARTLFEAIGDAGGLDAVDNELGLLAEERGDFVAAEAAFRRMLRAREQAGDDAGVAESLDNIGFAQFAQGDYDNANAYWQQALAAFTRLDDPAGIVQVQQNLGALETARGRGAEARRLLEASLQAAERGQLVEESAVSRFHLGQLALSEGRLGDALAELDRAQRLFTERDDRRGAVETALLRGQVLLAAGALPELEAHLRGLDAQLDEASSEQRAGAALLAAELASRRGDTAAAHKALAGAEAAASRAGMRATTLRVAIARAAAGRMTPAEDAALGDALRQLGHVGLQLAWLEQRIARALSAGRSADAAADYRTARDLLRAHPGPPVAVPLHAAGARALAATGDSTDADAARRAAQDAAGRIGANLPEPMRAAYAASAAPAPSPLGTAVSNGR
jgi:tetratricopeptide (TPR) repeat protein